ncbi:hypothetical protein BDV19DRAFT_54407 [Aspergillus venezuelensis]
MGHSSLLFVSFSACCRVKIKSGWLRSQVVRSGEDSSMKLPDPPDSTGQRHRAILLSYFLSSCNLAPWESEPWNFPRCDAIVGLYPASHVLFDSILTSWCAIGPVFGLILIIKLNGSCSQTGSRRARFCYQQSAINGIEPGETVGLAQIQLSGHS